MSHRERDERRTPKPDDEIADLWRESSTDLPPARVDAAIVAAARAAVTRPGSVSSRERAADPRTRARWTWRPLLAAAAVGGIAFAVLPTLLRHAGTPIPPEPARSMSAPAPSQSPANEAQPMPGTTRPPSGAPADARAAAPAAMPAQQGSRAAGTSDAPASAKSAESTGFAAAPPEGAQSESAPLPVPAPSTAADRAARIADLYQSGDLAGAAAELRSFRARQPDADSYLPSALQPWARSVK